MPFFSRRISQRLAEYIDKSQASAISRVVILPPFLIIYFTISIFMLWQPFIWFSRVVTESIMIEMVKSDIAVLVYSGVWWVNGRYFPGLHFCNNISKGRKYINFYILNLVNFIFLFWCLALLFNCCKDFLEGLYGVSH